MATINQLEGVQQVLLNLRIQQKVIAANVARGLKTAGLMLQRESQKLVPVNLGNLKASAFTRATGQGFDTVVNVGYTANYALYVHEAVGMKLKGQKRTGFGAKGKYWDPQGRAQAKFLEQPARTLTSDLLRIIKNSAKF